HYRFRKGYLAQGYKLDDLAYKAKFFPFAPWFAFILCSIIILGQNYEALIGGKIDWLGLLSTYISIPLFFAIWLGYKWKYKTKLVPYNEMDVQPANLDRE
ncbi:MAG: lysine transporter, partial [Acinetobacter sp.]|nr:lysine transporter [Acinetobacter sp.]